jgi:hypothetical protein
VISPLSGGSTASTARFVSLIVWLDDTPAILSCDPHLFGLARLEPLWSHKTLATVAFLPNPWVPSECSFKCLLTFRKSTKGPIYRKKPRIHKERQWLHVISFLGTTWVPPERNSWLFPCKRRHPKSPAISLKMLHFGTRRHRWERLGKRPRSYCQGEGRAFESPRPLHVPQGLQVNLKSKSLGVWTSPGRLAEGPHGNLKGAGACGRQHLHPASLNSPRWPTCRTGRMRKMRLGSRADRSPPCSSVNPISSRPAIRDISQKCQRRLKIRPCGVRKVYQAAPEKCATGRHRWRMERAPAGALSMRSGDLSGVRR